MCPGVVFTLVNCQIFLARLPPDIIGILCDLITNPEIPHLHQTGALLLDGVVCNVNSGGVVAMDRIFGLWMTQFLEGQPENHTFLAIKEERAKFGFGRRCHNEMENCTQSEKCTF